MPITAVIGAQWGDEGKGKVVDYLAQDADFVVRFNGGPNAGHTIINEKGEFKLHLIPSGIFNPGTTCIIGNGVAVNLETLAEEMEILQKAGVSCERLLIDERAHLIFRWHILLDELQERKRGKGLIGTTLRGIGPAFTDKIARIGLRVGDLKNPDYFRNRFLEAYKEKKRILTRVYRFSAKEVLEKIGNPEEILEKYLGELRRKISPYIQNTHPILDDALARKRNILLEGAQGALLDIDFGTYPHVTSAPAGCGLSAAAQGSGIAANKITEVIGVVKAYMTRVGSADQPFPTEMLKEIADPFREFAGEYGATTGRPRRCGWLDLMLLQYAVSRNGFTGLALTRLDTMSYFDEILICRGYTFSGVHLTGIFFDLSKNQPIYEKLPGWRVSIQGGQKFEDLPKEAPRYVLRIEELAGVPIKYISIGPRREDTIVRCKM